MDTTLGPLSDHLRIRRLVLAHPRDRLKCSIALARVVAGFVLGDRSPVGVLGVSRQTVRGYCERVRTGVLAIPGRIPRKDSRRIGAIDLGGGLCRWERKRVAPRGERDLGVVPEERSHWHPVALQSKCDRVVERLKPGVHCGQNPDRDGEFQTGERSISTKRYSYTPIFPANYPNRQRFVGASLNQTLTSNPRSQCHNTLAKLSG